MTTNSPPQGIQELILNKKRDRSMDALSRACGGNPSRANLQRLVSEPVKAFPKDLETIRGLARGLGVRVLDVVAAFSVSLGLPVSPDNQASLTLEGAGRLPEASKDLLRAMADQMLWWQEQVNDGPDPSAHEGVTSETLLPHNVHQLPAPSWESHAADSEAGKTSGQDIDPDQLPDE